MFHVITLLRHHDITASRTIDLAPAEKETKSGFDARFYFNEF